MTKACKMLEWWIRCWIYNHYLFNVKCREIMKATSKIRLVAPTSPPTFARSTTSSISPLKPRFQNASKPEMKHLHSAAETLAFRKRNTSIPEMKCKHSGNASPAFQLREKTKPSVRWMTPYDTFLGYFRSV